MWTPSQMKAIIQEPLEFSISAKKEKEAKKANPSKILQFLLALSSQRGGCGSHIDMATKRVLFPVHFIQAT